MKPYSYEALCDVFLVGADNTDPDYRISRQQLRAGLAAVIRELEGDEQETGPMIEITGQMVSVFLKNYASGGKSSDSCTRAGLLAVAPLIASAYQKPAFGTAQSLRDGAFRDALQQSYEDGVNSSDVRPEALRNAVAVWAEWFSRDQDIDKTSTVLDTADKFRDWLTS
jgi:hypothetical protein